MKERTFVECLRYNIEHNWNEGSLFESMTKDDCVEACDKIERYEKALRDISNAEDERKARGVGYDITVDVIAKIALGDI